MQDADRDKLSAELAEYEIVTRHLVMERDLNAFGNLFGGVMLAWIDESSALFVMERIGWPDFVTVNMDDVDFKTPARRGDAVVFYSRILKTGRSSITVRTRAFVSQTLGVQDSDRKREEIINCKITFVCLKNGKPFPYFESEDYRTLLAEQRASE